MSGAVVSGLWCDGIGIPVLPGKGSTFRVFEPRIQRAGCVELLLRSPVNIAPEAAWICFSDADMQSLRDLDADGPWILQSQRGYSEVNRVDPGVREKIDDYFRGGPYPADVAFD